MNNPTFDQLNALRERLENKKSELAADLSKVQQQLRAVETTIELIQPGKVLQHQSVAFSELRGKTQLEALVLLAEKNQGRLKTAEAKDILQRSGLMKSKKNASNILYNVINRSDRFERIAPGEYRLKRHGDVFTKGSAGMLYIHQEDSDSAQAPDESNQELVTKTR